MDNYRKPSLLFFHKDRLYISQDGEYTPKEIEIPKDCKDTQEYEDMICECPMTGTIEIMRRKVEK
jgi:hypothetical protein